MTHVDLRASVAQGLDEQTKVRDGQNAGVVNPADILMKILADPVRHLWRVCAEIDQITKHELWRGILGTCSKTTYHCNCLVVTPETKNEKTNGQHVSLLIEERQTVVPTRCHS